ncbi:hypothetical protein Y900_013095 [Mycolicibacterium aromaticivorans JS19b1 = JCM 16368]|uniref:Uncharacterized protein n=1 Tax=Mycolicibacterium aromaticivorans JS19b1 = JCM 16368 TaxID=1440774 RepID=A0A064CJM3_9MYCO|nr:hypothetical protein Y900_013095 [Mycolicibacterium aromaticivorans JS19b1 = JCM 16368]
MVDSVSEVGAPLRVGLGQFPDQAAAGGGALALGVDHDVSPGAQPLHAVQPVEGGQDGVQAVGDDGPDEGFLIPEVVVDREGPTPAAFWTSPRLVPATPRSYISCAAATTFRSRVARPLAVSRCASVTEWLAVIASGQVGEIRRCGVR